MLRAGENRGLFAPALASDFFLQALLVFLAGDSIEFGLTIRRGFLVSRVGVNLEADVEACRTNNDWRVSNGVGDVV